ncbi:hypothetical protein M9458_035159, partial [Cirrhinus mrigala]
QRFRKFQLQSAGFIFGFRIKETAETALHFKETIGLGGEPSPNQLGESETQKMGKTSPSDSPSASCNGTFRNTDAPESGVLASGGKSEEKGDGVTTEVEDRSEGASREDSEAVSALLASQEKATCVLLHASPVECEGAEGEHEISPTQSLGEIHSEARSDTAVPVEEDPRCAPPRSPITACNKNEDVDCKQTRSPAVNAEYGPVTSSEATHKPSVHNSPCSSPEIISKPQTVLRQKQSAEMGLLKDGAPLAKSMERTLSGLKMAPNPKVTCSTTPVLIQTPSPTPNRSRTPTHTPPRTPNRTPTPDKSTKSPFVVDRKEPFTIYRDPVLVRTELESHPTYIQPPHTPPNPKHHLKTPSPSSSSPSLTPATSHSKLLSPSPHPAHLSPIPLHSQPPLCSLSTPHSTIPHPHLLPSLLPAALFPGTSPPSFSPSGPLVQLLWDLLVSIPSCGLLSPTEPIATLDWACKHPNGHTQTVLASLTAA